MRGPNCAMPQVSYPQKGLFDRIRSLTLHNQAVIQSALVLARVGGCGHRTRQYLDSVGHLRHYIDLLFSPHPRKDGSHERVDLAQRVSLADEPNPSSLGPRGVRAPL